MKLSDFNSSVHYHIEGETSVIAFKYSQSQGFDVLGLGVGLFLGFVLGLVVGGCFLVCFSLLLTFQFSCLMEPCLPGRAAGRWLVQRRTHDMFIEPDVLRRAFKRQRDERLICG